MSFALNPYRHVDSIDSIVTEGLFLYLDAGNPSSYPGTGTDWYDQSGNSNDGTLINGVGYSSDNSGSLTFDGVDDYVLVTGSLVATAATFIAWIKRSGSQDQYDGIVYSRSTTANGMNLRSNNQLAYTWNNAANTYLWNSGLIIPDMIWCMCAVSISSSSAVAYLCQSTGITSATNSVSHASTTIDDINIGRDEFATRFFAGNIAQVLLYNYDLTAEEIQQNFNAQRSRFGI